MFVSSPMTTRVTELAKCRAKNYILPTPCLCVFLFPCPSSPRSSLTPSQNYPWLFWPIALSPCISLFWCFFNYIWKHWWLSSKEAQNLPFFKCREFLWGKYTCALNAGMLTVLKRPLHWCWILQSQKWVLERERSLTPGLSTIQDRENLS